MEKKLKTLLDEKNYKDAKKMLLSMNEHDIASIIEDLPVQELAKVFRLLPKDMATKVFVNMEDVVQKDLITLLSDLEAVYLLEDMFTDDAADLLDEMPAMIVKSLLNNVSHDRRNHINSLLKYSDNSAGSLMAMEYIHLKTGQTVRESIDSIRGQKDDFVSYDSCFVTDDERKLLGRVSIKHLILSDPDELIDNVMEKCRHVVNTSLDQEDVVKCFQDYDYRSLPVVDNENRLVGIITIDDVMDVMEAEATEDMEKMAAIVPTEKPYDKVSAFETFKARIPWLLLLMISATFTGKIIQHFEDQLSTYTILTAFIPMLMDTGGNAGGQASVSIIRALSLHDIEFHDIFKVIFKESKVAIMCAVALGVCNFIKMLIIDGVKVPIALVVCVTLLITIVVAKIIGCTLPMFAKKIGFDPAVMASPFITTLVDAFSLIIYFTVAGVILGF